MKKLKLGSGGVTITKLRSPIVGLRRIYIPHANFIFVNLGIVSIGFFKGVKEELKGGKD